MSRLDRRGFCALAARSAVLGALTLTGAGRAWAARPYGETVDNWPRRTPQIAVPNWLVSARRNQELPPGLHSADPFPDGIAALTFDDGPSELSTERTLGVLREHGLRAAFFVVGKLIRPETYHLVRLAARDGHVLGNHSYRHDVRMARPGRRRGPDYVRQEILLTQAMVDLALLARSRDDFAALQRRLIGANPDEDGLSRRRVARGWPETVVAWRAVLGERLAGLSPYPMLYFRPPGGQPFTRTGQPRDRRSFSVLLRELEQLNILWHGSAGDSDGRLPEEERWDPKRLTRNVLTAVRRGGVILMHDRIPGRGLDRILRAIQAEPGCGLMGLADAISLKYGCSPDAVLARLPSTL